MTGPRFAETYTEREFFKVTVPGLVKQLERLNELLERLVEARERERGEDDSIKSRP